MGHSLMGRFRIFHENIKIIQFILIIILIILFYIVYNSATNFQHRLLNGMHDLPFSTFKRLYYVLGSGAMWHGGNIGLSPG